MFEINFFKIIKNDFHCIKSIVVPVGSVTECMKIARETVRDLEPNVVFQITDFIV